MSTASKSPGKVAAVALAVGDRMLPRYGHRFSRHDFELSQLFACLVLRKFFRTDYRGIVAILADWPQLRERLRLHETPHFTTLQKAAERLLTDPLVRKLLTQTVAAFHSDGPETKESNMEAYVVEIAAADSTGLMLDRASRYFIHRRSRAPNLWQATTYRRFGKLGIIVDCDVHLILSIYCSTGPRPDVDELKPLLENMCTNAAWLNRPVGVWGTGASGGVPILTDMPSWSFAGGQYTISGSSVVHGPFNPNVAFALTSNMNVYTMRVSKLDLGYSMLLAAPIPAPGSIALLGLGGLVAARRRRMA